MKKNIFRRGISGLLAVLMTFTALMGIGTTTAFAASTAGETAESYSVGFPRDGDAASPETGMPIWITAAHGATMSCII